MIEQNNHTQISTSFCFPLRPYCDELTELEEELVFIDDDETEEDEAEEDDE